MRARVGAAVAPGGTRFGNIRGVSGRPFTPLFVATLLGKWVLWTLRPDIGHVAPA